jgi:large subunit ribosomal protein L18
MDRNKFKTFRKRRRQRRIRKRVFGTTERPRLSVFRSLRNVYAQVIDDSRGTTITSISSLDLVRPESSTR